MQDAFVRDMFNLSDVNNPRYNGHVQVTSCGKTGAGGKRDRKGCTKGKIEAIMKNNTLRAKVVVNHSNVVHRKSVAQNHVVCSTTPAVKTEERLDEDPYTFTEPEPVAPSTYHHQSSTPITPPPPPPQPSTPTVKKPSIISILNKSHNLHLHHHHHPHHHHHSSSSVDKSLVVKTVKTETSHGHSTTTSTSTSTSTPSFPISASSYQTSKIIKLQSELSKNRPKKKKVDTAVQHVSQRNVRTDGSSSAQVAVVHQNSGVPSSTVAFKRDPNSVTIPAKREARRSTWQRERNSKHELLERIQSLLSERKQYTRDLYPLGVEQSDSDSDEVESASKSVYERHWFSRTDADSKTQRLGVDGPREQRIEATRSQFRRRLAQTLTGLRVAEEPSNALLAAVVAAARRFPNATAGLLEPSSRFGGKAQRRLNVSAAVSGRSKPGTKFLTVGQKCSYSEGCVWQALPCTRHCFQHIMYNVDQRLFSHCTGRTSDNTPCNRPTFDVLHDPPLCPLHASSEHDLIDVGADANKLHKKSSKKSRIIGSTRSSKRTTKKKKKLSLDFNVVDTARIRSSLSSTGSFSRQPSKAPSSVPQLLTPLAPSPSLDERGERRKSDSSISPPPPPSLSHASPHEPTINDNEALAVVNSRSTSVSSVEALLHSHSNSHPEELVEEEVLAIANLDPAEFASQASRLLEEHDLTNVLSQISTDAFNDLFTDKNGEYEPTREETEELERALEAVNNDVRSLERMSMGNLPLLQLPLPLDPLVLLDETEGFAPFQNGLGGTGPGSVTPSAASSIVEASAIITPPSNSLPIPPQPTQPSVISSDVNHS